MAIAQLIEFKSNKNQSCSLKLNFVSSTITTKVNFHVPQAVYQDKVIYDTDLYTYLIMLYCFFHSHF